MAVRIRGKTFSTETFVISLILILAVSSVAVLAQNGTDGLTCEIKRAVECDQEEGEFILFRMFDYNNSHAAYPAYGDYEYAVCCNQDIHSDGDITSRVLDTCEDYEEPLLSFNQSYNTHVESPELNNYDEDVCVTPYMNCTLEAGDGCGEDLEHVVSLFNVTDSHVSNISTLYDYDLCCEVPDPDEDSYVCEKHDGWGDYEYRWDYEELDERWDVSEYPDYDEGDDHPGSQWCCGDNWEGDERVEWPRHREYGPYIPMESDEDDWACAMNETSCVYENKSYPECYEKNVTGDDYKEICWRGEWGLGREEGGRVHIDGSVIDWDTARIVEDANVIARIIYQENVIAEREYEGEIEEGRFEMSLNIPEEYMERGRTYTIEIETEKDGERSFIQRDIVIHRKVMAYLEECDERRRDW